ncbi:hypothetical protein LCGC14_0607950 [marine sediment metagenome]|uniref:Uncharacterized protein n=1 Tax=marine sediment metagenome TaxID=412755 RepID=A0A0F9RDD4_9ZZZZ
MASPLATEKVLRGILQSLQRAGVISSGSDVAKLESIPNNATDADISAILDTVVFGGVAASTDVVRSDEDVNIFIDANNNDGTGVQRFFRVSEDQSDPPVTDADNELMSVSRRVDGALTSAQLIVGPRNAIAAGAERRASIKLGANGTKYYGTLWGGPTAVGSGLLGIRISSDERVSLQADTNIQITDEAGSNLRGGWSDMTSATRFHVGDFLATPEPESMTIEQNLVSGTPMYTFRPSHDGSSVRRVYFRGSNAASDYRSFWSFGGKAGETYGDPSNFNIPTFMVVGDDSSTTANAAYIYDRKNNRAAGSEIFTIKANTAAGPTFNYFRIRTSLNVGVFSVKGDGSVNSPAGYTTGAADVAEVITADAKYDPGTVLAIQGGSFTATTEYQQTNVAGVVATKPGLLLGNKKEHYPTDATILSICGFVPVLCSTERGNILGNGEFLVSGPDGCAVVDQNPKPGTIIGKAKGTLVSDDAGPVRGMVEVLVNLQ